MFYSLILSDLYIEFKNITEEPEALASGFLFSLSCKFRHPFHFPLPQPKIPPLSALLHIRTDCDDLPRIKRRLHKFIYFLCQMCLMLFDN